jgi:hypothetical protein
MLNNKLMETQSNMILNTLKEEDEAKRVLEDEIDK